MSLNILMMQNPLRTNYQDLTKEEQKTAREGIDAERFAIVDLTSKDRSKTKWDKTLRNGYGTK